MVDRRNKEVHEELPTIFTVPSDSIDATTSSAQVDSVLTASDRELLAKSDVLQPGFEKKETVPAHEEGRHRAARLRKVRFDVYFPKKNEFTSVFSLEI